MISFLTHWWFRRSVFNFQLLGVFPDNCLLLTSSLILLQSANILCMIAILNLWRHFYITDHSLIWWIIYVHLQRMYILVLSGGFSLSNQAKLALKVKTSLFLTCVIAITERGKLKYLLKIVGLSFFPFQFYQYLLNVFWSSVLVAFALKIVMFCHELTPCIIVKYLT